MIDKLNRMRILWLGQNIFYVLNYLNLRFFSNHHENIHLFFFICCLMYLATRTAGRIPHSFKMLCGVSIPSPFMRSNKVTDMTAPSLRESIDHKKYVLRTLQQLHFRAATERRLSGNNSFDNATSPVFSVMWYCDNPCSYSLEANHLERCVERLFNQA